MVEPWKRSAVHPQAVEGASGVLPLTGLSCFTLGVQPAAHTGAGGHTGRSTFDPGGTRMGLAIGGEQGRAIIREEEAVLRLVARVGVTKEAICTHLTFTLAR